MKKDIHSLQRRPDYHVQDIHGSFGYWSELVFSPSRSTRPKGAPLQGNPRCEPPRKERVGIFGKSCEILEQAPGFRRYSPLCQCFKEAAGESLDRSLSQLPHWLNTHPPFSLPPPFPPAHHPLTVIISICYQTPCFIYVVSSGPLWPTFYRYTS